MVVFLGVEEPSDGSFVVCCSLHLVSSGMTCMAYWKVCFPFEPMNIAWWTVEKLPPKHPTKNPPLYR